MPRSSRLATAMLQFSLVVSLTLRTPPQAHAQADDRAAIRATVEQFFAADQSKDLAALMSLWSERSPDLASYRESARRVFAAPDAPAVKGFSLGPLALEDGRAKLRLAVETAAAGQQAAPPRKRERVMQLVKEGETWKVWRYLSSEDALAEELVRARDEDERRALLEENKGFVSTTELVRALGRQGRPLLNRGQFEEGLRIYELGYRIAETRGDKPAMAYASGILGIFHYTRTDYEPALEHYQRALTLAEEIPDKVIASHALNNIAVIYGLRGDNGKALEHYQKSLRLAEETGNKSATANAVNNIGTIHAAQGNHAQSLAYFQRSLKLVEELGLKPETGIALENIGSAYQSLGDYAQALAYLERGLKLHEELGDKAGAASALGSIGALYGTRGDYARALSYYERSLKLAEEAGDRERIASTLNKIGNAYVSLRKYEQALDAAQRSAATAVRVGLPGRFWQARTTEGDAHRLAGRPAPARAAYLEAIKTVEELRAQVAGGEQDRQRFFEDKVAPYHGMVELSVAGGDLPQALSYAERAKGRVLLDVLSRGRVDINKAMTADELKRGRALTAEVTSLNARISELKQGQKPDAALLDELEARLAKARLDHESFQTSLYAAHPELKVQRGQTGPLTLDEMAGLLSDGKTALLEYVTLEDRTYLFVVTRAGEAGGRGRPPIDVRLYPIAVKGEELGEMARAFRRRIAERDLTIKKPARQLYDLLVKPAERQLLGARKLCIVPDGPLWELPFQALWQGEQGYLLEQYAVFYAPSLAVLREMVKRGDGLRASPRGGLAGAGAAGRGTVKASMKDSLPSLFAVGNPRLSGEAVARVRSVDGDEPVGPLPDTEKEVNALAELYGRAGSRVLTGETAREETVKSQAGAYTVLHFATHAQLDDRNPMYSRVMLSHGAGGGAREDGLLETWEIMNLDLAAEMVVLSACQTARGRVGAGEGMIGMSWALFVAGSPAAVVSQWKVDSARTAELMVEFHRNLLRGGPRGRPVETKAGALREASLKILRGPYNHPVYWAGFVLIGDEK